jgi:hypothetical protein
VEGVVLTVGSVVDGVGPTETNITRDRW